MEPIFSNSYNIADALIVVFLILFMTQTKRSKEDAAVVCGLQMKLKTNFE